MPRVTRIFLLGLFLIPIAAGCSRPVEEIAVADPGLVADLAEPAPAAGDWPWWRGRNLDGKAEVVSELEKAPPVEWSADTNILWRTTIPGEGHASPIVWGEAVYVAYADSSQETQSLAAYDRSTGKPLWTAEIHRGGFMHKHSKNSHASATPACDGERLFTVFMVQDAVWTSAVDVGGKVIWSEKTGAFQSMHGYGSSPVLYKSLVIVAGDNQGGGFLAAHHRQTGKLVWRVARKNSASFGTPLVATVAGKTQLLLSGQDSITSYNPENGDTLWTSRGPASTTANTMAIWSAAGGDLVFASGGYPQSHLMAVKADGTGEVVWENDRKGYVPSLLVDRGRLFLTQDDGILRCFEAENGKELWVHRLGGNFSASPVLAGDNIYLTSESGKTTVFKSAAKFELVAENQLGESGFATPAICGERIYLRAGNRLYCVGEE